MQTLTDEALKDRIAGLRDAIKEHEGPTPLNIRLLLAEACSEEFKRKATRIIDARRILHKEPEDLWRDLEATFHRWIHPKKLSRDDRIAIRGLVRGIITTRELVDIVLRRGVNESLAEE